MLDRDVRPDRREPGQSLESRQVELGLCRLEKQLVNIDRLREDFLCAVDKWKQDVLKELEKDRVSLGFTSIPALVNYLLTRYVRGETIKRGSK